MTERFWQKVVPDPDTECWEWCGCVMRNGYGQFRHEGRVQPAHRVAWDLLRGPIPDGLHVDHLCRNRRCVNPAHLEPVTQAENNRRVAALRTHCKHGHPFDERNTYVYRDGRRKCRACRNADAARRWRQAA